MFSDHRLLKVVGLSSVVSGCGSLRKKRASHCPDTLTGPSISIRPHWRAHSAGLPPRRSPLLRDRRNGPLVRQIAAQLVRMRNWTASFGGIGSTASPRLIPDAPFGGTIRASMDGCMYSSSGSSPGSSQWLATGLA
jgi:hypothetical protein